MDSSTLADEVVQLRFELRLLAEEGTLPKWQVVDIPLDCPNPHISHYVLWRAVKSIKSHRVFLAWDEVDDALAELELT